MDQTELWDRAKHMLREEVPSLSYTTWIEQPLKPVYYEQGTLALEVPSDLYSNTIGNRYLEVIRTAVSRAAGEPVDVRLMSVSERVKWQQSREKARETKNSSVNMFNPKSTFETFVVGSSNQFAHAAALAVAEQPGQAYNPLFVYGGVGLGKTHLMHAIGHFIEDHYPSMRILYMPSETFTNELVSAIKNNRNNEFRERFRNVDVLMLDDIQFIAGREATQEEFFHTFNALRERDKQIIISSDKPPKEIKQLEERLRSRFEWGLIADIQKPDFDTRVAILRKKAENEGIDANNEVLELIARRVDTNIRELEGSLTRVQAKARLLGLPIDEKVVNEALADIVQVRDPKRITPELILSCVAGYYQLTPELVRGSSRKKEIALARHVAVYLTREMTDLSLPRIGDAFSRDHSTIINSCEKVAALSTSDPRMRTALSDLRQMIKEQ